MKTKIYIALTIVFGLIVLLVPFLKKEKKDNQTIRVAEVTHSAFYTPWYVAIEKGYFEDEGIDIELILTPGADKVTAAVLSGDVQVGFCGPESSIYVYNGGEKDYIQTFAGLTKRDGQFIVGRKKITNFSLEDLIGKEVLVGRKGGMPALNFEKALVNEGISANKVTMNMSVEFGALSGAFIGGTGDFVNLFEPNATKLEKEGLGYVVGTVGKYAGEVPYTAFNARKSFINENKNTLTSFTKAINKGLDYVSNNNSQAIAKVIINQFPDTSLTDLTTIIDRYKNNDSWLDNPFITEKSFKNLEDIMVMAKQIDKNVNYEKLINNLYEK